MAQPSTWESIAGVMKLVPCISKTASSKITLREWAAPQ